MLKVHFPTEFAFGLDPRGTFLSLREAGVVEWGGQHQYVHDQYGGRGTLFMDKGIRVFVYIGTSIKILEEMLDFLPKKSYICL